MLEDMLFGVVAIILVAGLVSVAEQILTLASGLRPVVKVNQVLEYKGYFTRVLYSADDKMFYGKISGIKEQVVFHCEKPKHFTKAFHDSVDNYLKVKGI